MLIDEKPVRTVQFASSEDKDWRDALEETFCTCNGWKVNRSILECQDTTPFWYRWFGLKRYKVTYKEIYVLAEKVEIA